jgi:hypothetical protein
MPSIIFQPLLYDSLGYKMPNSTYADHYKWRKQRKAYKEKLTKKFQALNLNTTTNITLEKHENMMTKEQSRPKSATVS